MTFFGLVNLALLAALLCAGSYAEAHEPFETPAMGPSFSTSLANSVSDSVRSEDNSDSADLETDHPIPGSNFVAKTPEPKAATGVDWMHVASSSITMLAIQNAFRCATEPGTRDAFNNPFWSGHGNALASMHGWSDGDPFHVNYFAHPIQGSVTNFMWQHNDRAYRDVVFGANTRYWKARLRSMAFTYVYSLQFEIGPFSEASIGQIQALYPAYGFVDHVVTPVIGTGWTIAEDILDKYVIRRLIEAHVSNPWIRLAGRIALNPTRSFANIMNYERPQHRDNRPGVFQPYPESSALKSMLARETAKVPVDPPPGVAPFEFTFATYMATYVGSGAKGSCIGGGGEAAFRLATEWQFLLRLNGCKLQDLPSNVSGDSLTYMIGPRWTPSTEGRWTPHVQLLIGGNKLTQEEIYPDQRAEVAAEIVPRPIGNADHWKFAKPWETHGFAIAGGAGVDYKINDALAWRVASLDYQHRWSNELRGTNYQNAVKFTTGLVLRMGTW